MSELGDDYVRRIASMIRTNERSLAEGGLRRRKEQVSTFNPLGWFGPGHLVPLVLAIDTHHLFYLLMRFEAIGIEVGSLEVKVDSPSRPMSYINLFPGKDKSETLSLASFRSSFSAVSNLSLGVGWWGRQDPLSLDSELKYIFGSFTKLPALQITPPGPKVVAELAEEPPNENAIPLDSFKNLQSLECVDIDPRTLLGWDRLAESLRSLKITKSGIEDVSDVFIAAVIDDQARREGTVSPKRRRRLGRPPDSIPEEDNQSKTLPQLSSLKWAFLKHLSLSDNSLTFFPANILSYLTPLTHLDLSSNLFVSVPAGLGTLYNLISLNISDNMIDSVLGIYQNLGQVLTLNLSKNRLDSICGLERLHALERVDLRNNLIEESAEVGRLATLPNIAQIWVEGNPFVEYEEAYRVTCFNYFGKEGKLILLDGTPPSFYEKRYLTAPLQQTTSSRPVSAVHSPPTVAVGHPVSPSPDLKPAISSDASPTLNPTSSKPRKKKAKRIVDLDGDLSDGSSRSTRHRHTRSDDKKPTPSDTMEEVAFAPRPARHSRYQTEHDTADLPSLPNFRRGSQTFSSKSAARRARVTASVFEPSPSEGSPEGQNDADAFRRKIEALKKDMGDGWLKVFNQSQLMTPT